MAGGVNWVVVFGGIALEASPFGLATGSAGTAGAAGVVAGVATGAAGATLVTGALGSGAGAVVNGAAGAGVTIVPGAEVTTGAGAALMFPVTTAGAEEPQLSQVLQPSALALWLNRPLNNL